jgi:hypothetical protein
MFDDLREAQAQVKWIEVVNGQPQVRNMHSLALELNGLDVQ